ncbi:UsfY protein [Mycobacterium alsense]|uniref:UsfY protein n=1 Tax=Mycobacterium alsense TaxID=324058 RepID=A0AA41XPT6_9MYCO|nr:protein UsfY [Mycobacterium alsense]MCV7379050.1 UsfY protein [Mycobacterium alsense]OQZ89202.1 UsfY protein [Mycobacterium alsense]
MGDRHRDPTDHYRTTQPHAGFSMKDNLYWPGFILMAVSVAGMISTTAAAAYGHYEWLATTVLVAVLGIIAAALWFVMENRRVSAIDARWGADGAHADADNAAREHAASKEPTTR